MSLTTPTKEATLSLFTSIESQFPTKTLGNDKWYILTLAALVGGGHPELAADLYLHLISRPEHTNPDARKALVRRLREVLVKLVSVVGVPKPIDAVFSIAEVEKEEDKDYSFSRENWSSGEANRKRGRDWLDQIYKANHQSTENTLAAHRDFSWLSIEITYGLYLSDHSILNGVETELVVLSGIMIQNLPRETGWHLRGTRRIGVSFDDVETIQQCIETVAAFCGLQLTRVPRVKDIEHEVVI
ncbi:hypothetical protein Q7P35_001278 [Cladosporium inversicolor]